MTMHSGENTHTQNEARACSGKCRGQCSRTLPRVWVIAASHGLVSVLLRLRDGFRPYEDTTHYTPDAFCQMVRALEDEAAPAQVIIVGGESDRAWVQAALPLEISRRIVAEIPQSIDPSWLVEAALPRLCHVLLPLMP